MANDQVKKDKRFFKDFKAELKKVIWPSSKQLINNTSAVIIIVLIVSAIVFVLDVAFESMNTYGIDKIKSLVTSNEVTENAEAGESTTDDIVLEDSDISPVVTEVTSSSEESVETENADNTEEGEQEEVVSE